MHFLRSIGLLAAILLQLLAPRIGAAEEPVSRRLYVVCPGIRNYLELGGAGILVFDIDRGHQFIKRIATSASLEAAPDNIKGVCGDAATGRLFFTTRSKLYSLDLLDEKVLWEASPPNGTDRMSITPDGRLLYVPSIEKDTWNVIDPASGKLLKEIETKSGAHNTVVSRDGKWMFLGGLKSPYLFVADTNTHTIAKKIGPMSHSIRPFVVDGKAKRAYICVNDLLGFEVADIESEKRIHRVQVTGVERGVVKRHGCPSHGIGLTPDEREVWVVDAANQSVHVFDNTVDPPAQRKSIKLREQPGWITFSLDGAFAYLSTGEIVDVNSKKIVAALADDKGNEVHSEKMLEVHWQGDKVIRVGDQFGLGRVVK
jgi:DNA-binding beta-propeller fold protein YncE